MPPEADSLRQEIEAVLEQLAREKGQEWATRIRSIVAANFDRKRLQKFTGGTPHAAAAYIHRVSRNYERLHPYLHQLQIERSDDQWELLLPSMRDWAYRYLVRKGCPAGESTADAAKDCASEAARSLFRAHFPYDTDFEPWAKVIVHHACLKYLRRQGRSVPVMEESLEDLEESVQALRLAAPPEGEPGSQDFQDVLEAVRQLSAARRQVIELRYLEGLSPAEIAARLGKKVGAVHSLQFHGLEELRKILARNRDMINE